MSTVARVLEQKGSWVLMAPVRNLHVGSGVDYEYRIDRVVFISAKRLARRRRRLGLPMRLSELRKYQRRRYRDFFSASETYAVVRGGGRGSDLKADLLRRAKEELAILCLSQLGYSRRRRNAAPVLGERLKSGDIESGILVNTGSEAWVEFVQVRQRVGALELTADWEHFHARAHFHKLVRILRRDIKVSPTWRKCLWNAAVLAGQSQVAQDLPTAFLCNWIAIETLLLRQGEKHDDTLPERAEAFLGWTRQWKEEDLVERLQVAYRKRNALVHDANRAVVGISDVLFVDDLILNVFHNLARNPAAFGSKERVLSFSERVKAEKVLGLDRRPRAEKLQAVFPRYTEKDYDVI